MCTITPIPRQTLQKEFKRERLSTRRHNAREIINCFVGCYTSTDIRTEDDVALMNLQEQLWRMTDKSSSKEIRAE